MQAGSPPADPTHQPLTLLLVATSPSDLTELEGTARALAQRGNLVTLAYFYSGGSRQVHSASLEKLRIIPTTEPNVQTHSVDVDQRVARQMVVLAPDKEVPLPWAQRVLNLMQLGPLLQKSSLEVRWRSLRLLVRVRRRYRAWLRGVRAVRRTVSRFMMIRLPTPYAVVATAQLWRIYKSYGVVFDSMLAQRGYHAIVVPEDIVGPFWPQLVKTGLRHRIPTIILPYTLANQEEAFKSLRGVPDVQTSGNRLAAMIYPRWRLRRDGADIVRMPAGHIFVHEWMRLAPPDPWMMNSGRARMICVDSQASFDYFRRAGIPAKRLQVTGSASQDQLAAVLQDKPDGLRQLRDELGLAGDKPLLLLSGCPNQLAGWVPHCEFADMPAVAAHLGEALRPLAAHYHLVVRPHPNYVEFGDLMRPHGVHTSLRPTAQLVPLADVFIAFASATIRWAAGCGIPVVNYDIFHYGYSDFAANKGVATVSEPDEFIALVGQMVPGSAAFQEAHARSQSDAAYWSVMDGRGLQRIEDVLRQFARP
jgi:hypothetical protein